MRFNENYNPNGVHAGLMVRVFTGKDGWDFNARVARVVEKKKERKAIVFLEHDLAGMPHFADAADCYPLRGAPLYPGHHDNG